MRRWRQQQLKKEEDVIIFVDGGTGRALVSGSYILPYCYIPANSEVKCVSLPLEGNEDILNQSLAMYLSLLSKNRKRCLSQRRQDTVIEMTLPSS